jgi:hypothetical protein
MSRAGNEAEQLRDREDEVEDLRDKKEEERLWEVGDDSDARESHAGEVAERVAGEGSRWVPETHSHQTSASNGRTRLKKGLTSCDRADRCRRRRAVP